MRKSIMPLIVCFFCIFIFSSNLYAADGEWVNNQGCYCGGYPSTPVSMISKGSGTTAEREASQDQMEYWNLYAAIYATSLDTGLGAPGNGLNEINTFITSAQAQSIYGYTLGTSTYGVAIIQPSANFGTFDECKDFVVTDCGPFTETDILMNADFSTGWTTDINDYNHALVQTTALHELGHTWGAHHVFTLPVFGDSYSTMNYINDDSGRFVTRMDANTIRGHDYYSSVAQTMIDVGIFPLIFGNTDYGETYTSVSPTSVQTGDSINISNFLIQNIGTEIASYTVITFYLSTDTTIEDTDYVLGTVEYTELPVDADNDLNASLTVPSVPDGTYYIGAIVTVDGSEDSIGINNRFIIGRPDRTEITVTSASTDPITHTLTPPSSTTVPKGGLLGPFYASTTNNTSSDYSYYLESYIGTPDGAWRLIFQRFVTLGAGATGYANNGNGIYIVVPSYAPTGTHSHCVNLYDTSYTMIDQDCFSFEVTSSESRFQLLQSKKMLRTLLNMSNAHVEENDGWKMIVVPGKNDHQK